MSQPYLTGTSAALFTDFYELTMAQAYVAEGMLAPATFSLFYRTLPDERNYLLSCGADDVADFLSEVRFSDDDLTFLRDTGRFSDAFLDYLADFHFTGEVMAVPDGTPVFPQEPLVEVTAPLPEAQIMETWVINQMHAQSVLATKAARIVTAAAGRPVLDFGLRRIHGADGGLKAARAFHLAGVTATSNVLAGRLYGVPLSGTMAHSYVQAHDSEMAAFRAFTREFPETVLLVDTYDTLAGVQKVIDLAGELGNDFKVHGVRIDSGDLADLARRSRKLLDDAGLSAVQVLVSGGLDEFAIEALLDDAVPVDGFGVGTAMGISTDAPELDIADKLVDYNGSGRMKLSTGKPSLPGAKQIYRRFEDDTARGDVLARRDETRDGTPLLEPYVRRGRRVRETDSAERCRQRADAALAALPAEIRAVHRAAEAYPVTLSDQLQDHRERVQQRIEQIAHSP
ncbi:MAG: nicotinate phosphoribosyltransferase [Gammaproteobacteria bacterium]|nr:nicotinate phosphoribosyltransferase [Gammaproteobacteria bacterium]